MRNLEEPRAELSFVLIACRRDISLYQRILREGLSVRKVEELAQQDKTNSKKPREKRVKPYATLENELSIALGVKVKVMSDKLIIPFATEADLSRIAEKLI